LPKQEEGQEKRGKFKPSEVTLPLRGKKEAANSVKEREIQGGERKKKRFRLLHPDEEREAASQTGADDKGGGNNLSLREKKKGEEGQGKEKESSVSIFLKT